MGRQTAETRFFILEDLCPIIDKKPGFLILNSYCIEQFAFEGKNCSMQRPWSGDRSIAQGLFTAMV